jgi:hypothetical protein
MNPITCARGPITAADCVALAVFAAWLRDHQPVTIHPDQLRPRDCVCAVDLPDGTHLELPERPEVLAARTLLERHVTVVAFLDRDAEELPEAAVVTVVRPDSRKGAAA